MMRVTSHRIRRLIQTGVLAAEQVVFGAPRQILAQDLAVEPAQAAVAGKGRPFRVVDANAVEI